MKSRSSPIGMVFVPVLPNWSRPTTRNRKGRCAARSPGGCRGGGRRHRARRCASRPTPRPAAPPAAGPAGRRHCASSYRGSACPRGVGRHQVGDDVPAAEGVDRLFGIPDKHHRRDSAEGLSITAHRTGSVSWNSSTITIGQRRLIRSRLPRAPRERVGQSGQQVVVAEDSATALADFQFGQRGRGEVDACRRGGSRLRSLGRSSVAGLAATSRAR